jgi:hypothetical protein
MPFESSLSGGAGPVFDGGITKVDIQELKEAGPPQVWETSTNIRTDQDWQVVVAWYLQGTLLNWPAFTFEGEWVVSGRLESMGTGTEHNLPEVRVSVDNYSSPNPERRDYTATISVPHAGPNAPQADVYKVVAVITYKYPNGNPGPIAGFDEAGMLQIYAV